MGPLGPPTTSLATLHFSIAQVALSTTNNNSTIWKSVNQLGLIRTLSDEWNSYITILKSSGISLINTKDNLVWSWNMTTGTVTTNLAYQCIASISQNEISCWWLKAIWRVNIQSKIICFMWLCLKDHLLTGANFRKRGGIGRVVCSLCLKDDETIDHIFIRCEYTQYIWKETLSSLKFSDA
jgi:hypothetical protein